MDDQGKTLPKRRLVEAYEVNGKTYFDFGDALDTLNYHLMAYKNSKDNK